MLFIIYMRLVAGEQSTPYVVSTRPMSLANLKEGRIMGRESELGMQITDATTVEDVFRYVEEHADEVDAKVVSHPPGTRSVRNGFLLCYESKKVPAFQIITRPSSKRISRLGVTGFRYAHTNRISDYVEPTLYVFARAPREGKDKWYTGIGSTSSIWGQPSRPAGLALLPIGTVLRSRGGIQAERRGFMFIRVTKHLSDSKMIARGLETVVSRRNNRADVNVNGIARRHVYLMPGTNFKPWAIELIPHRVKSKNPVWVSKTKTSPLVEWTTEITPVRYKEQVLSRREVEAGRKIRRALWKAVQKRMQEQELAPGGATARAVLNRVARTAQTM